MPETTVVPSFDYASLDRETADFLQQQTGEIRALMRRSAQDIFEIGQKLIELKQRLGHGQFGQWLEAEFDWTERLAQQFMNVARQFKPENFADLQIAPSALYLLAAPSTPEGVREEALARARDGEPMTHKKVKEIKQQHAPQAAPAPPPLPTSPFSAPPAPAHNGGAAAGKPLEIVSLRRAADQAWSQLGDHWLFWGHPNSDEFRARLPEQIAFWLAFPPRRPDWPAQIGTNVKAALSFFLDEQLPLEADDLGLMAALLRTHLNLYSEEEGESLVLAFLPTPDLLLVAQEWGCRCFLADPDPQRCQAVQEAWTRR
jgi:hypothetical protein